MSSCQPGIFDKSKSEHLFIEYRLAPTKPVEELRESCRQIAALSTPDCLVTLALGPGWWQQLPSGFAFAPFSLAGLKATQGDLLLWLQASNRSELTDTMLVVKHLLGEGVSLQLEQPGFVYRDSRDLTGFVDGIGNPKGERALQAALVPAGQAGEGGSFMITQRWCHQLDAFNALLETEQEKVIGRTKADAREFDESEMPADAHVARTDVSSLKIWRRSVPFADVEQQGLYFVGFACEQERLEKLLQRMYGLDDSGVVDRLTHYSEPLMSSYWFAPSADWLA